MDARDDGFDVPADPAVAALRDRLLNRLIGFVASLRRRGVQIPANATIDGARALATVGLDDREQARAALRAALIAQAADVDTYESLFPAFWRSIWNEADPDPWEQPEMNAPPGTPEQHRSTQSAGGETPEDPAAVDPSDDRRQPLETDRSPAPEGTADRTGRTTVQTATYSPAGPSRAIGDEETVDPVVRAGRLGAAVDELGDAVAGLEGRRWRSGGTDRVNARRAMRRSVATGGAVSELPHVSRATTAVQAVLLVDVSQSVLDTIDRDLLVRVLAEIHARWRRVRTFFFDTELREVTHVFAEADPDRAMTALQQAEAEWGGGTRIGHAVEAVCDLAPPAIDRDTAVFVISDGLEVGEIDRLERGMAALDRRARLVLWLNPLAADPDYEPATRGMEAALPHIDGLFAFVEPGDLREVARQLRQRGPGGHIGYEFDPRRIQAQAAESTE